jgi:hypothetical protein
MKIFPSDKKLLPNWNLNFAAMLKKLASYILAHFFVCENRFHAVINFKPYSFKNLQVNGSLSHEYYGRLRDLDVIKIIMKVKPFQY